MTLDCFIALCRNCVYVYECDVLEKILLPNLRRCTIPIVSPELLYYEVLDVIFNIVSFQTLNTHELKS